MSKPKRKKKGASSLPLAILYMLIGAGAGLMMLSFMEEVVGPFVPTYQVLIFFALLILSLYVALAIQLAIHEAGHLFFGLLSGYQFSSFRIFHWMWVKNHHGEVVRKHLTLAGTGGQCLMAPPELKDGQMPVILYNLGGVLMNAITSALFFGLSCLLPTESFWSFFLRILSFVGIAIAVINGIPVQMGPAPNDGCNTLSFLRSKEAVRAFWVQMKVNEETAEGTRLKDMPEEWFAMPGEEELQIPLVASVGVFRANRFMDEHRFAEAKECIENLLSGDYAVPGLYEALLTCDLIFIDLFSEDGLKKSEDLLTKEEKQLMKVMKDFPSVLRTEYALALASGKVEEAQKVRQRFEKIAPTYPYACEIEGERELLEMADQRFKEHKE